MHLRSLKEILLVLVAISVAGCVHYPKNLKPPEQVSKKNLNANIGFYGHLNNSDPTLKYRINEGPWVSGILKEIERSELFKEIRVDYEDISTDQDLVIEIFVKKEVTPRVNEAAIFWVLLPLPLWEKYEMTWNIYNQNGFVAKYVAYFEYTRYRFFGFAPVGAFQYFKYDSLLPEIQLTRDIVSQISKSNLDTDHKTGGVKASKLGPKKTLNGSVYLKLEPICRESSISPGHRHKPLARHRKNSSNNQSLGRERWIGQKSILKMEPIWALNVLSPGTFYSNSGALDLSSSITRDMRRE